MENRIIQIEVSYQLELIRALFGVRGCGIVELGVSGRPKFVLPLACGARTADLEELR